MLYHQQPICHLLRPVPYQMIIITSITCGECLPKTTVLMSILCIGDKHIHVASWRQMMKFQW